MKHHSIRLAAITCILALLSSGARSAPLTFDFFIPFWSYGDFSAKTLRVTVDNGTSNLTGQSYSYSQIRSLELIHFFDLTRPEVNVSTFGSFNYFFTDQDGTPYLDLSNRSSEQNLLMATDGTWSIRLSSEYVYRAGGLEIRNESPYYYSYFPYRSVYSGLLVSAVPEVETVWLMTVGFMGCALVATRAKIRQGHLCRHAAPQPLT